MIEIGVDLFIMHFPYGSILSDMMHTVDSMVVDIACSYEDILYIHN